MTCWRWCGSSCARTSRALGRTGVCTATAWATPNALKPVAPKEPHKSFEAYKPGYLHMDIKYLPQMQDESKRRYLFVAIDRATRWVVRGRQGQQERRESA